MFALFSCVFFFSSRRRHTRCALVTGVQTCALPISFTAYGLSKGAFLSTEAASSLFLYVAKVLTFHQLGAMPLPVLLQGLLVDSSLMAGTFIGKGIDRKSVV